MKSKSRFNVDFLSLLGVFVGCLIFYYLNSYILYDQFYHFNSSIFEKIFVKVCLIMNFDFSNFIIHGINDFNNPYFKNSIIFGCLFKPSICIYFIYVLTIIFLLSRQKKSKQTSVKYIFFGVGLIFTIYFTLYNYNFYYDRLHLLDRLLLLCLFLISIRYNSFILLFVPTLFLIMSQFNISGHYCLVDKEMPINILIIISSFIQLTAFINFKKFQISNFFQENKNQILISMILIIIASSYYMSFFTKFFMDDDLFFWIKHNDLGNEFIMAINRGWITKYLNHDYIILMKSVITKYSPILLLIVFLIQGSSLFINLNFKTTNIILVSYLFFHVMVFILTGIFFWKWILSIMVIIMVLNFTKQEIFYKKYNFRYITLIIVLLSPSFIHATKLGWLDTKFDTIYELTVIDVENNEKVVDYNDLSPLDINFNFSYEWEIFDGLSYRYASISPAKYLIHKKVNIAKSPYEFGKNTYSPNKKEKILFFVKKTFKNLNKIIPKNPNAFNGFKHFYNQRSNKKNKFLFDKKIETVNIYKYDYFYHYNQSYFNKNLVYSINLDE